MKVRSFIGRKIKTISAKLKQVPKSQNEVEKNEQIFYIKYLQSGMVVFDVGANIGEISLLFSRFVGPNGKVHSFECTPSTFHRLKEIIKYSNRKNIVQNCLCLSDKIGEADLYVYNDDYAAWNTMANRPLREYGIDIQSVSIEKIPTTTIDEYCVSQGVDKIDLLKIDVEGAEYQVLKGASRMLREKRIQCVVFEFGQTTFDMGNKPEEMIEFITGNGYTIRNLAQGSPIFPGGASAASAQFSMHICTLAR